MISVRIDIMSERIRGIMTGLLACIFFLLLLTAGYTEDGSLARSHIMTGYFQYCGRIGLIGYTVGCLMLFSSSGITRLSRTDLLAALLIGWILLTDRGFSQQNFVLLTGITYFVARALFSASTTAGKIALMILFAVGVTEIVVGLRQLYGFSESNHILYQLTGSFFNPGPYSGFMAILFPLALHQVTERYNSVKHFSFSSLKEILRSPEQAGNYLLFAGAAACVAGIITLLPAGMSRGAWLAGAAGSLVVLNSRYHLLRSITRYCRNHRKRFVAGMLTALLLASVVGGGLYRMKKDSADGRMLMWKISALAMADHLLTGTGTGMFPGTFGETQAAYFASAQRPPQEERVAGVPEYGFNEYLQIGTEHGMAGLLLFLGIAGSALRDTMRPAARESAGIAGSLTALLIFAAFSYPLRVLPLCLLTGVILAMAANVASKPESGGNIHAWMSRSLGAGLILLTFWITKDRVNQQAAYVKWAEEKSYYDTKVFSGTVNNYRALYPWLKHEGSFLFEYGHCLFQTGQHEESIRILEEGAAFSADPMFYNLIGKNHQALRQYGKAEDAFKRAGNAIPHRLYPLYLEARMYFESGQTAKGLSMAELVIAKTPKVMSESVKEMKEEMAGLIAMNRFTNSCHE